MQIHPNYSTIKCVNGHDKDKDCSTKSTIIYVTLCVCGASVITTCNAHPLIVDPLNSKYMCAHCGGIKICPTCNKDSSALFVYSIEKESFDFLDPHIRETVALKFLQKDPKQFDTVG